jgi:peroxiredoxin
VQLQNDIESIEAAGIQIIGISYDSVEILKEFADKKEISFRLLSDPDNKTIEAYGVLNEGAKAPLGAGFDSRAPVFFDLAVLTDFDRDPRG